jgi:hypothetical protein
MLKNGPWGKMLKICFTFALLRTEFAYGNPESGSSAAFRRIFDGTN